MRRHPLPSSVCASKSFEAAATGVHLCFIGCLHTGHSLRSCGPSIHLSMEVLTAYRMAKNEIVIAPSVPKKPPAIAITNAEAALIPSSKPFVDGVVIAVSASAAA